MEYFNSKYLFNKGYNNTYFNDFDKNKLKI